MSSSNDFSSRLRRSEAAQAVNRTSQVDEVRNARQAANRQIIYAYAAIIEWYTAEDGKINWVKNEFGEQEPSCTQDFVKLCRDLELLGENTEVLTKNGKILERFLGENDLGRKIEQKIQSLREQSEIIEAEEDSSGILDLFNEYTYQMWKTYLKSVEESDKRALENWERLRSAAEDQRNTSIHREVEKRAGELRDQKRQEAGNPKLKLTTDQKNGIREQVSGEIELDFNLEKPVPRRSYNYGEEYDRFALSFSEARQLALDTGYAFVEGVKDLIAEDIMEEEESEESRRRGSGGGGFA